MSLTAQIKNDVGVYRKYMSKKHDINFDPSKLSPISPELKKILDQAIKRAKNPKNLISRKKFLSIIKREYGITVNQD
jgi:hypothetical protein